MHKQFVVGSDPEFIIINRHTKLPVSVIGEIGGSKRRPRVVEKGAVQEDNVLAEINTHPAKNKQEWVETLHTVVSQLEGLLPEHWAISTLASAEYPASELEDPLAVEFGCDPDFNAWNGATVNKRPRLSPAKLGLRSAGGHIHIQMEGSLQDKIRLIQVADCVIGVQSVILDKDTQRKELYGKAGAFRFKPYGVEYRVPSNFWVFGYQEWIYDAVQVVRQLASSPDFIPTQDVVNIINSNNQEHARSYLDWLRVVHDVPINPQILGVNTMNIHN